MRNIPVEKMTKNERMTYYEQGYKRWKKIAIISLVSCGILAALFMARSVHAEEIEQCDEEGNCWIVEVEDEEPTATPTPTPTATADTREGANGGNSDAKLDSGLILQEVKETRQTASETLETVKGQGDQITALTTALTATQATQDETGITPAPNVAIGLQRGIPIYLYKLQVQTSNNTREFYIASNSADLYIAKVYDGDDTSKGFIEVVGGLYHQDGMQQYVVGLEDKQRAYEGKWGHPNFLGETSTGEIRQVIGSEAQDEEGIIEGDRWIAGYIPPYTKVPSEEITPYTQITMFTKKDTIDNNTGGYWSQNAPWGYIGRDGKMANTHYTQMLTLTRLDEGPSGQEWTVEQLYLPVIVIMACGLINVLRRKY